MESWLTGLPSWLAYLVGSASIACEAGVMLGMVLPGTTMVLILGLLAHLEVVSLAGAIITAVAAGLTGDNFAFRSGRRLGPKLRSSKFGRRVGTARWAQTDVFIAKHGSRAVFLGQWVVVIRTLVPRAAASSGMSYRRFALANTPSVIAWGSVFVAAGFLAGRSYEQVASAVGLASGALGLLTVTAIVLLVAGRWVGRHPDPVHAAATRLGRSRLVRWLRRDQERAVRRLSDRFGPRGALAVNAALGLALMVLLGVGLILLSRFVITTSGLPGVDQAVASWARANYDRDVEVVGLGVVSLLRSSFVIVLGLLTVFVVGLVRGRRSHQKLAEFAPAWGFVLLLLISLLMRWLTPPHPSPTPGLSELFGTQVAVVTAALLLLAMVLARRATWAASTAMWTFAALVVMLLTVSRIYVGGMWASEAIGNLVLGGLWAVVLAALWNRRSAGADASHHTLEAITTRPATP